jgi:hypothetical protein
VAAIVTIARTGEVSTDGVLTGILGMDALMSNLTFTELTQSSRNTPLYSLRRVSFADKQPSGANGII